jgi:hypothetical protein
MISRNYSEIMEYCPVKAEKAIAGTIAVAESFFGGLKVEQIFGV